MTFTKIFVHNLSEAHTTIWHIDPLNNHVLFKKDRKAEEGEETVKRREGKGDGKEGKNTFIYVWAAPGKQIRRIILCLESNQMEQIEI